MEGEKWCSSSVAHSGAFSSPPAPPPRLKPCVAAVAAVGFAPRSPPRLCVPTAQPPVPTQLPGPSPSRGIGSDLGFSPTRMVPLSPVSSCPGIRLPSPPATCCYGRFNGDEGVRPSSADFADTPVNELLPPPPPRQTSLSCPPCQEKAQRRPLPSVDIPRTFTRDSAGAHRRALLASASSDSAFHSCAANISSLRSTSQAAPHLLENSPRPSVSLPSPPRTSPDSRCHGLTLSVPALSSASIESARRLNALSSVRIPERFACEPQIVVGGLLLNTSARASSSSSIYMQNDPFRI